MPVTARLAHHRRVRALPVALLLGALALGRVSADEAVTLNLREAEIGAFIETVAKMTGRNFVVDPRVKGKVTVISAAPMSDDALYDVFLSVLRVHGYAAIEINGVTRIVPDALGRFEPSPVDGSGAPADALGTLLIPLENVQAEELVPLLRPLLPQEAHLAAHAGANVLVAADRTANLDRLLRIVRRIDTAAKSGVEVIRLEHASAGDLVEVLGRLTRGAEGKGGPSVVADERTNSLLLGGDEGERLQLRAVVSYLDTPTDDGGDLEVVYLHYAAAEDLVPVLQSIGGAADAPGGKSAPRAPAAAGGTGVATDPNFQVQADAATNALILQAPPQRLRMLRDVIRRLDVRRAQVLVEGIIAEVSNTKAAELGLQWKTAVPGDGGFAGVRLPGVEAGGITDPFGNGVPALLTGLSLGYFSGGDLRALLRALSGDQATNVLSTPTLVTMDNAEAEIVVGQNVPFVTGQFTNNSTTPDNPFQTIERQDVGVVLRVKPQINEGDAVKLDIEQEVSNIDRASSGGADLITNKRAITTSVLVDDRQIIVLGGLISDDLRENTQKVPLLGELPLLGALFRNQRADLVKTNLMVFLRPTILRDGKAGSLLARQKYDSLRALQSRDDGVLFMPGETRPRLPAADGLAE